MSVSARRQAGDIGPVDAVGENDGDWLHRPQTVRVPRVSEFIQAPEPDPVFDRALAALGHRSLDSAALEFVGFT